MHIAWLFCIIILRIGSCVCNEGNEPFTPGGCINEFNAWFAFEVDPVFDIMQVSAEAMAPDYTDELNAPQVSIVVERGVNLDNNADGDDDAAVLSEEENVAWVAVNDQFECPVAASHFQCMYAYKSEDVSRAQDDRLRMSVYAAGNSTQTVCFVFEVIPLVGLAKYETYIAGGVFILVFIILSFELVSRALVAMIGDIVLFGFVWAFQGQPSLETVMGWLDWQTMVLLTSMMIVVAIFAETGFFEFLAWNVLKLSNRRWHNIPLVRRKWRILFIIGSFVMTASAFLDNCTTVMLFAPVTLQIARLLEADPIPFLMSMIYFCSLGGATTYVGDPPNLLIGGQFGLGFNAFLLNCGVPILLLMPFAVALMYAQFKTPMQVTVEHLKPDGTAAVLPDPDQEGVPLKDKEDEESVTRDKVTSEADLDAEYRIRSKHTFWKCAVVIPIILILFALESETTVSTTWIALMGSGFLLLITTPRQIAPILEKVEWPTLFFFAYLFVFVQLIEKMGVIYGLSNWIIEFISSVPMKFRLPVSMMCVLWMSALFACWCNNIAFTAAFIPVIYFIANKPDLGVPLRPLAWTLALGVALSANATLIAAAPNLIVAQIASRAGFKMSFLRFLRLGFPFMLCTTALISIWLLCVYWWWDFSG